MDNIITNSGCLDNVSDTVTVLEVGNGKTATKTFRWDGSAYIKTHDFDAGMWFGHDQYAVCSIQDLSQLLTAIEASQDSFIIRGKLAVDAPSKERVRRMKNPDENGDIWFIERPRYWLLIDIDDFELPEWADPASDPERIVDFLINQLPDCFHGVTCHWQMSSSAGVKPATQARAHLWFWLDRALDQEELKRWRAGFGVKVDQAVFNTVQPLYVARPIFVERVDPLPRRSGRLTGDSDVVAVPEIDMNVAANFRSNGPTHEFSAAPGFESKLALLGDGEGLEGFHYPLTSAIASYVSEYGADIDTEALKNQLRQQIDAAPKNPGRGAEIERYKSNAYLNPSIRGAISRYGTSKIVPAIYRPPEGDLEDARAELSTAIGIWRDDAIQYQKEALAREARLKIRGQTSTRKRSLVAIFDPEPIEPVHAIEASTGIGKSYVMRETVQDLIPHLIPGHAVFVAVPSHRLSDEMAEAFSEIGVRAAVYRGLSAYDPETPGQQMCRIASDAEALRRGGGKLKHLCNGCPHAEVCGWQRQLSAKAEVWVGAHNLLFHPSKAPLPPIDFVVVDESPISTGLRGFSVADEISISAAELKHRAEQGDGFLGIMRHGLAGEIEQNRTLRRVTIENCPLSSRADARTIWMLVYAEIEKIAVHGGMTAKERQAVIEVATRNHRRLIEVEIWKSLGAVNEDGPIPGLRIEEKTNSDGTREPRLRLRQRRSIHSDFRKPTLLLDATPQWDAYGQFWGIDRIAKIEAAMPHVNVRQIIWSASGAKLLSNTDTSDNNCRRMLHYIESRAAKFSHVLVLCQMVLEEKLGDQLPENVEISHFNAVRGLDKWRDVDCLILIGRTQPPPIEIEMQAEAMFDEVPDSLGNAYYSKKDAGLTVAPDDLGNCVQMEYHPDSHAEMMRWLTCEAELIQCVGRARGVKRTVDTPLQIDIIGIVPLPFSVNEVLTLPQAKPDPLDIMAGRGVALNCEPSAKGAAMVVAAVLPDLFETSDAVKSARNRSRCQTPNNIYSLGKRHRESNLSKRWPSARLRLAGSRYSVPIKLRRGLWRGLREGETPPPDARLSRLWGTTFVLEPLLPEGLRSSAGYILRN